VQVGLVDNDLAKNFAAEIALKADVRETLRVLVPAIESAGGPSLAKLASDRIESLKQRNWSTNRHRLEREILQKNGAIPTDPDWIALQVISSLPPNAILVDEGLTSFRYMSALRAHHDRYGYHQMASGGIGWGLPASVGASFANPERPVVCYSGDRSNLFGRPRTTTCRSPPYYSTTEDTGLSSSVCRRSMERTTLSVWTFVSHPSTSRASSGRLVSAPLASTKATSFGTFYRRRSSAAHRNL
jgi:hypothetical protein